MTHFKKVSDSNPAGLAPRELCGNH